MPKELHEISQFITGTITTPSERDIPDDAASYSLNIDPTTQDGVLQGVPQDENIEYVSNGETGAKTDLAVNATSMAIINDNGSRDLIYFDDSDDKIKKVDSVENAQTASAALSSTAESKSVTPTMQVNNREVHIGMGSASADKPLWAGHIGHGQFGGSAPSGLQLSDAKLFSPSSMPPFDKIIKIGDYLYGAQDGDSKVYSVTETTGILYNQSFDIFFSIVSIAYHNSTSFWVLDKVSSTTAELKLVDASSFEVTQTSTITGITVRGNSSFDSDLSSNNEHVQTFSNWLSGTNTGGGADFITDILETSGKIWYIRGCGAIDATSVSDMIKWRWLFRSDIPTSTSGLSIYDVSFRTNNATGASDAEEGVFYEDNDGSSSTNDINVLLQIPFKSLVDCGTAAGVVLSVYHADGETGELSIYQDGIYVALRDGSNSNGLYSLMFIFTDTSYTNYGAFYTNEKVKSSGDGTNWENSFRIRKFFWGSSASAYLNKTLSSANYDGESGSTLAVTFHTNDSTENLKRTFIALQQQSNYVYSSSDGVKGNISLTDDHYAVYEIRSPFIHAIDSGTGSVIYLSRGSKSLSTKKHQLIKSKTTSNSSGNDEFIYSKEADLSIEFTEVGSDANWVSNTSKIFYKTSYSYDGYQESPLSNAFIHNLSDATKRLRLNISIHNLSDLSKRVSHLNLYVASSTNSTANEADGFYRLATTIKLNSGWTSSTSDEDGSYNPAWGSIQSKEYLHNGKSFASYESRTGISEVLLDTLPNYSVSTSLNNHLFISGCHHTELDDAKNYLFKSKAYNYDQFNWINDFLILPTFPTAIASFNGRIYVFDENNMYQIEPNNLYIEDKIEGKGCISQQSIFVNDYGMCFADKNNIYLHNGKQPIAIGDSILRGDTYAWENRNTTYKPVITFDSFRKSYIVFFGISSSYYSWSYNILRKRWDLWKFHASTIPQSAVIGKEGEMLVSNGTNLVHYLGHASNKRLWDWKSKKLNMRQNTGDKSFKNLNIVGTPTGALNNNSSGGIYAYKDSDAQLSMTSITGLTDINLNNTRSKHLQIQFTAQTSSVDAIGTVFRRHILLSKS